ncbi:hypothetical protein ON010_g5115 [Phytophthora cinnamomi]|nr:hypothetical protein ON010_g5115 [Phytophthora cinnamomi]
MEIFWAAAISERREEEAEKLWELNEPPVVEKHSYYWPQKILTNPRFAKKSEPETKEDSDIAVAYVVKGQSEPRFPIMDPISVQSQTCPPLPPEIPSPPEEESPRNNECHAQIAGPDVSQPESDESQRRFDGDESETRPCPVILTGGGETSEGVDQELKRVLPRQSGTFVGIRDLNEEVTVFYHEGSALLSDLRDQLAALPELKDLNPKAGLSSANIGEVGETTSEIDSQIREILESSALEIDSSTSVAEGVRFSQEIIGNWTDRDLTLRLGITHSHCDEEEWS